MTVPLTALPILLQGWGVRATLEDRKTQTRRVILPQPTAMEDPRRLASVISDGERRYGKAGDLLWVRESFYRLHDAVEPPLWCYRANNEGNKEVRWHPSIHMPREACRLLLRRTGELRAERVQQIGVGDVRAEGIKLLRVLNVSDKHSPADYLSFGYTPEQFVIAHYAAAWDSINADPKPAKHNPYTGAREDCYVSFPWKVPQWHEQPHRGRQWYVVGNPWIYVVSYERVKQMAAVGAPQMSTERSDADEGVIHLPTDRRGPANQARTEEATEC